MNTAIEIPQEQWGALIGAAVMQAITPENRDLLVKEAIRHLLTPEKDYRGNLKTPLQQKFDAAIELEAGKIVREMLTTELRPKVEELVRQAMVKTFEPESADFSRLVENISEAISSAFKVKSSY